LKPTYPPTIKASKKQRIWALASDGKYSPDQIASMVGTTIDYVWKETSRYKKARTGNGLIVSKTTELSKRKAETSIFLHKSDQLAQSGVHDISASKNQAQMIPVDNVYLNGKPDRFLDIPKMELADLKTLYTEFNARKKPADIIANHGFHPDIVEFEYQRFLRLSGLDVHEILQEIIADCNTIMEPRGELKLIIDKYHREGNFQNNDIYELLSLKSEHEWQSRLAMSMFAPKESFPEGVVSLKCNQCNEPISGVLINHKSEIGKSILDHYANFRRYSCTNPTTLDQFEEMRKAEMNQQ
jgi:hypothetical protein